MTVNNTLHTPLKPDVEFRCPQCQKLFKAKGQDILSANPQFACNACHALFSFTYPPVYLHAIVTRQVSLPQVGRLAKSTAAQTAESTSGELKTCPKCAAVNPRGISECYRCGIVFAKMDLLANQPSTLAAGRGLPSLIKMWHELLHDYNNLTKHLNFVDRCEEMHALPFALKKYKDLQEVQPHDSLAQQMLSTVLIKSLTKQAQHFANHPRMQVLKTAPWANMARISPVLLALLFILIGVCSPASRNLAGTGVALLFLALGLMYFVKGNLHWRHFWR